MWQIHQSKCFLAYQIISGFGCFVKLWTWAKGASDVWVKSMASFLRRSRLIRLIAVLFDCWLRRRRARHSEKEPSLSKEQLSCERADFLKVSSFAVCWHIERWEDGGFEHSGKAKEVGISETLNVHTSGVGWDGCDAERFRTYGLDAKESNHFFIQIYGLIYLSSAKYW